MRLETRTWFFISSAVRQGSSNKLTINCSTPQYRRPSLKPISSLQGGSHGRALILRSNILLWEQELWTIWFRPPTLDLIPVAHLRQSPTRPITSSWSGIARRFKLLYLWGAIAQAQPSMSPGRIVLLPHWRTSQILVRLQMPIHAKTVTPREETPVTPMMAG